MNSRLSQRRSDEVPEQESEPESRAVVKGLLEDVIGEVVKEREESEKWERLMSNSKQINDDALTLYSEAADETDSDGCFDDRRRLPYDFCTRVAADYDYSSATTTSDDESAAAPSSAKQVKKSR